MILSTYREKCEATNKTKIMFRDDQESLAASTQLSVRASDQVKVWEKSLSLRISLQKALDVANRLPVFDLEQVFVGNDDNSDLLRTMQESCRTLLHTSNNILELQVKSDRKRRRNDCQDEELDIIDNDNDAVTWGRIENNQRQLRPRWESVINKWHSRLHFGSSDAASKMKTFKQTLWEQIDAALEDSSREMDKSRSSFEDSRRMDKSFVLDSHSNSNSTAVSVDAFAKAASKGAKTFDAEVYDDRQFYSTLLKVFQFCFVLFGLYI